MIDPATLASGLALLALGLILFIIAMVIVWVLLRAFAFLVRVIIMVGLVGLFAIACFLLLGFL